MLVHVKVSWVCHRAKHVCGVAGGSCSKMGVALLTNLLSPARTQPHTHHHLSQAGGSLCHPYVKMCESALPLCITIVSWGDLARLL